LGKLAQKPYWIEHFQKKASLANTNPQNEAGNKTLIYSTNQEDLKSKKEDSRYINRCWNLVWEDYLKLTLEEEKRNLFTLKSLVTQ
jgi:hypothetical protein